MPRCSCAGSTCGCKVQGGAGIEVTGLGTAASPYIIAATIGDLASAMTFDDTADVVFEVVGDGVPGDPLVISATTPRKNFPVFPTGGLPDPAVWGEGAFAYDSVLDTPVWSNGVAWATPGAAPLGVVPPVGGLLGPSNYQAVTQNSAQFASSFQGAVEIPVAKTITIDRLLVHIQTADAASNVGITLWKMNDGATLIPLTRIAHATFVPSATGMQGPTISPLVLTPGRYFAAAASPSATLRMYGIHSPVGVLEGVSGDMPVIGRRWQLAAAGAWNSPAATVTDLDSSGADNSIWVGVRRSA